MAKKINGSQKVGLLSRIDYGGDGFRRWLVRGVIRDILQMEGTHYNILVGGLVAGKKLSEAMEQFKKERMPQERIGAEERAAIKAALEAEFLENSARELEQTIPRFSVTDPENPEHQKEIDFFITTSPAFDSAIGEHVAQLLEELRTDVRVWKVGGDRFLIKHVDKIIWALAPEKAVWMRGDYYSTAVERVIKDKIKRTRQRFHPDIYAVGCFGTNINKPKGELKFRYVALPNASHIEETRVAENQVGVTVLEYPGGEGEPLFRNYNLKDLIARELEFITEPPGVTPTQQKLIDITKTRGGATPGIFRYDLSTKYGLDVSKEAITKELENLTRFSAQRNWPGIVQQSGKKFYFNEQWIREHLKYSLEKEGYAEDRIISFACLHAGSVETDYEFFVNQLPQIILRRSATILVDAGDTKEGTKHSLMQKSQLIAGMNNTKQEKFAAHLIGTVIFKVFRARFVEMLRRFNGEKPPTAELPGLILSALLDFYYILGNHDLWETEDGHDPLELFHYVLWHFLAKKIKQCLEELGLSYVGIMELVESKIRRQEVFTLPSGLKVSIQHPHMPRALTTSLRPQQMLNYARDLGCQVAIGGNFHVAECICEWDMDLGQCVSDEIGTIKHGSDFERKKMKLVDQGVGWLRILSNKQKIRTNGSAVEMPRIFMTESAFYGGPRKPPVDNLEIVNSFVERLGVEPLISFDIR